MEPVCCGLSVLVTTAGPSCTNMEHAQSKQLSTWVTRNAGPWWPLQTGSTVCRILVLTSENIVVVGMKLQYFHSAPRHTML